MSSSPQGKGDTANAVAGTDAVEIKVTVSEAKEAEAEAVFDLQHDSGEQRSIYFFDTRALRLFGQGVILRARKIQDGQDDSTVKFRPVEPADIAAKWRGLPGFKIEADAVGKKMTRSASLSVPQRRDEIDEVAQGQRAIEKLFSAEQEAFIAEMSPLPVNIAGLVTLGPVDAIRWKRKHPGLPYDITAELWRLPDGRDLLELSIKLPSAQAAAAGPAFTAFMTELGLEPAETQETKTRVALEYFARR